MIGRELPFVTRYTAIQSEDERAEVLRAALKQLFAQEGFEVVIDLMLDVVNESLRGISLGDEKAQFYAGQIAAVEIIRDRLREYSSPEDVDTFDEGLTP